MNTRNLGPLILLALAMNPPLGWARRPHKASNVTTVNMQLDAQHGMVAISCQIGDRGNWHVCVIDSGATHTLISDRVLKPQGPLTDVTVADGVIQVHQQQVSLKFAGGLELKSQALVQSKMAVEDVDVFLGQDILRQFRSVIFDYENHLVRFQQ